MPYLTVHRFCSRHGAVLLITFILLDITGVKHIWDPKSTTVPANGPLTRYVKLQVAHAPGMPGTFSPAADFKENRLLAIPACITARAWRTCRDACRDRLHAVTGKTFPAFPAHAHPQFYVSGKRPMGWWLITLGRHQAFACYNCKLVEFAV